MAVSSVTTSGAGTTTASLATDAASLGTAEARQAALDKITQGKSELGRLGLAFARLRSALRKLSGAGTGYTRSLSDTPVVARSRELGLSYEAGDNDLDKHIADVPELAGVLAGNLKVNGVSVAVDPATDTLREALIRIEASAAGVTASVDTETDRLEIVSGAAHRPLSLDDNGTGFFSALQTTARTYAPAASAVPGFNDPRRVRSLLREAGEAMAEIFADDYETLDKELLQGARDGIGKTIADVVRRRTGRAASGNALRTGLGLAFDFGGKGRPVMEVDAREFSAAAEGDFGKLQALLLGDGSGENPWGLAPTLIAALDDTVEALLGDLGGKLAEGAMVDVKA